MAEPELSREEPALWQELGPATRRQRLSRARPKLSDAVSVLLLGINAALFAFLARDSWVTLAAGAVVIVVVIAIWVMVTLHRFPVVRVDLARGLVGFRSHTVAFSEIDRATLQVVRMSRKSTALGIGFGRDKGPTTAVMLRVGDELMLDERQTALLIRLLEASGIEMPRDSNDPTGRFAHVNFPSNFDRAGAIDLVRTPPTFEELFPGLSAPPKTGRRSSAAGTTGKRRDVKME